MTKEKEPEAQQKLRIIGYDVIIKSQAEAVGYFKSEKWRTGAG
jgi:hypothetical protein